MNNNGDDLQGCFESFTKTWEAKYGIPMAYYSSPKEGNSKGTHIESIDLDHFEKFLKDTANFDFDIMLKIKDKETSALKAVNVLTDDKRFNK